jgi:hypothetical protein
VEDVFFRLLQPFYSPGIPETVNHKRKKGNLKWLSKIQGIKVVDIEVNMGKARGNNEGRKERNSPTNLNRHRQGLDIGCRESGLWKCRSMKADK